MVEPKISISASRKQLSETVSVPLEEPPPVPETLLTGLMAVCHAAGRYPFIVAIVEVRIALLFQPPLFVLELFIT